MNKFAFITHPMDIEDIHRNYPLSQKTPDMLMEKVSKTLLPIKAFPITEIKTSRGETQGYCMVIPLTLKQIQTLPQEQIFKKIIKAGMMARKMGADIIGLGGGLSSIAEIGDRLEKELSTPVTIGQSYAIGSTVEGIKKLINSQQKDFKECEITILIDANFRLGNIVARYLAKDAKYLTVVSKDKQISEDLCQKIFYDTGTAVHISNNIEASIRRADIIVADTMDNVITGKDIKSKSIIWDLSTYESKLLNKPKIRKDINIVDNSILKFSGEIDFGIDLGFSSHTCCANMTEVILLALEGHLENFSDLEKMKVTKIDAINDMAMKNNVKLMGVSNIYKEKRMLYKSYGNID